MTKRSTARVNRHGDAIGDLRARISQLETEVRVLAEQVALILPRLR